MVEIPNAKATCTAKYANSTVNKCERLIGPDEPRITVHGTMKVKNDDGEVFIKDTKYHFCVNQKCIHARLWNGVVIKHGIPNNLPVEASVNLDRQVRDDSGLLFKKK